MEMLPDLIRLFFALGVVLALMGGLVFVMKKLGLAGAVATTVSNKRRLRVIEALPLDGRRRAVLLGRDDVEHLVILGVNSETVVETDIPSQAQDIND